MIPKTPRPTREDIEQSYNDRQCGVSFILYLFFAACMLKLGLALIWD